MPWRLARVGHVRAAAIGYSYRRRSRVEGELQKMALTTDTFKDLIGDFADDAKKALDDILDRTEKKSDPSQGLPGAAAGVTGAIPGVAGSVYGMPGGIPGMSGAVPGMPGVPGLGGFPGAAGWPPGAVEGLATLPEQIARLSKLIEALLKALDSVTSALGAASKTAPPSTP